MPERHPFSRQASAFSRGTDLVCLHGLEKAGPRLPFVAKRNAAHGIVPDLRHVCHLILGRTAYKLWHRGSLIRYRPIAGHAFANPAFASKAVRHLLGWLSGRLGRGHAAAVARSDFFFQRALDRGLRRRPGWTAVLFRRCGLLPARLPTVQGRLAHYVKCRPDDVRRCSAACDLRFYRASAHGVSVFVPGCVLAALPDLRRLDDGTFDLLLARGKNQSALPIHLAVYIAADCTDAWCRSLPGAASPVFLGWRLGDHRRNRHD